MKQTSFLLIVILLGGMSFLVSCGNSAEQQAAEAQEEAATSMEEAAGEMQEAAKKMEEAAKKMADGETVEVADFRKLKELLPDKLAGLERKSSEGEKAGGFGFTFSTATGRYEQDDKSIKVSIADTGGVGMAIMGMAAWSQMEMDRESEDGYERTTTIDGYKAFEKYNTKNQQGEVSLIVDNRFVVTLDCRNVTPKEMNTAIKTLNLNKLGKL